MGTSACALSSEGARPVQPRRISSFRLFDEVLSLIFGMNLIRLDLSLHPRIEIFLAPHAGGTDDVRVLQMGLGLYQLVERAAANADVSGCLGSAHASDSRAFHGAVFNERVAHNLLERLRHML
jgi:hypothetical protein